jgi:hypothetical protein
LRIVAIGCGISVALTAFALPWLFGVFIPLGANIEITALFTIVSIARSFALRRLFETRRVRGEL